MDGSQAIAAGAALSVFSYGAQHDRLIRMEFPQGDGPDPILLPNRLSAREEVSRCFRVEVELLSDDARIPLKAMMARMVTMSVVREDGSLRYFNGYVTEFRFLRAVTNPEVWDIRTISLPSADTWKLLTDDKKGTLTVRAGTRILTLKLQPAEAAGDETVPAERSAHKIAGTLFVHGKSKESGYEHQDSYANPYVLGSMLYSIVKIAATAKWD